MIGKIFITRQGYDPRLGRHIKDPYLGAKPTWGACRPDIRKILRIGDHIFVISGKVPNANQFVIGGFEIAEKISAAEAFERFPEQRLRTMEDGQLTGNVVVTADGKQHELDTHKKTTFGRRVDNYVVGRNPVVLETEAEVAKGREQTMDVLSDLLQKRGATPFALIGRPGKPLTEKQVIQLREWLESLKENA